MSLYFLWHISLINVSGLVTKLWQCVVLSYYVIFLLC